MGNTALVFIALGVICYFIGNISPARIAGRAMNVDILESGSGNPGTTNVLRVMGKKAAAFTLIVDILKGYISVQLARYVGVMITDDNTVIMKLVLLCSFCTLIGHCWPIVFKFRGGKGIATTFGILLALRPHLALIMLVIVAVTVLISRRVSLGSLVGAFLFPSIMITNNTDYVLGARLWYVTWCVAFSVIVIIRHLPNIYRLLNGEEPKLSFGKAKAGAAGAAGTVDGPPDDEEFEDDEPEAEESGDETEEDDAGDEAERADAGDNDAENETEDGKAEGGPEEETDTEKPADDDTEGSEE